MNNKKDLSKEHLYESVKTLVDLESATTIHFSQHKLFSLFSIAFQYMLYRSTKCPGAYILRFEDSQLLDKISKRAKDPSTRKFLQALHLPRKLKYERSIFYLDFFHVGSWKLTNEIPVDKIQGAIVVKNSSVKPMDEVGRVDGDEPDNDWAIAELPKDYYLTSLQAISPKTIAIAFDEKYENVTPIEFPFIKKEIRVSVSGVKLSKNLAIDLDEID